MGMSSWILDQEEEFWDIAADFVSESETIEEAVGNTIKYAKDNWLVPHFTEEHIEDGVYELWNDFWSKYQ